MAESRSGRARRPTSAPRLAIVGGGKVGTALVRALRARGVEVVLWRARALPSRISSVDALILCVRDAALEGVAQLLAERLREPLPGVAIHTAGSLGPSALVALSSRGIAVGQAHPLLSFAGGRRGPSLEGAALVVQGEPGAVRLARWLSRVLGMRPVVGTFDPAVYHAAASLVANGAIALAAVGAGLLTHQELPARAELLFAPLLHSVAEQLSQRGLPASLSGPVRRGDRATIERHLRVLEREGPRLLALYRELVASQLPLAAALGEASPDDLSAIDALLRAHGPPGPDTPFTKRRNRARAPRRALSSAQR